VQFIGDFSVDPQICDRLVELHRECDRRGMARKGEVYIAGGTGTVDRGMKDSFDVVLSDVPDALQNEYGVPAYQRELQRCTQEYTRRFPKLANIAFGVRESPILQHYRPGGGFKAEHFERMSLGTVTRILVWMTFLNDVTDAGGTRFVYQDAVFDARKGRTLIWPPDFTHTHAGVVSPTQHKYIITGWFNFLK
jgi:prolyl 4-hydroxylase